MTATAKQLLLIEQLHTYTLPELARKEGVTLEEYPEFTDQVVKRVEAGEFELVRLKSQGWELPAVRKKR